MKKKIQALSSFFLSLLIRKREKNNKINTNTVTPKPHNNVTRLVPRVSLLTFSPVRRETLETWSQITLSMESSYSNCTQNHCNNAWIVKHSSFDMSVALYSMNRKILTTLKEICMYIAKQRSNPTNICSHESRMIIPSFHIIVQFAQNSTLPG